MSVTCDSLVGDIQQMFKNINEKATNYWGVGYKDQFAPLGCLKCSKCMYDLKEFSEFGPSLGKNSWFCSEDAGEYYKKLMQLETTAKKEGKDYTELYERAVQPLREKVKLLKSIPVPEDTNWVYLDRFTQGARAACCSLLGIKRFGRASTLSPLHKELVGLVAHSLWETRYNKVWAEANKVQFEKFEKSSGN